MAHAPLAERLGEAATGGPFGLKGMGWAMFEFARNPYYNLVVIYIFAPYFASAVVGDPVQGQALVARTILIAGLVMAVLAPVLGYLVDRGGVRKPPIFAVLAVMALGAFCLWWIRPGVPGSVTMGMALMASGYVCYSISELFHNSMLPDAGEPKALPYISGLALSLGNLASVGLLIAMLALFIMPGTEGTPLAGAAPLFGLDQAAFEHLRITGPIVALWLVVFIVPFFLFMPDIKDRSRSWRAAVQRLRGRDHGAAPAAGVLQHLTTLFREHPNVMRYLVGRMIYADGMAALLTIGAVYVAGFLAWTEQEVLIYGILASVFAILGGFVGGVLDRTLGPKRALILEISVMLALLTIQLSVTKDAIFFGLVPAGRDVWDGPIFTSLADVFYVAMIVPIAITVVACITSSRYMLVHIAPPQKIGEFFGFYAMAGSVTVWLGPGLVDLMTSLSGDQRIGMTGIGLLFAVGLAIIWSVEADRTPTYARDQAA